MPTMSNGGVLESRKRLAFGACTQAKCRPPSACGPFHEGSDLAAYPRVIDEVIVRTASFREARSPTAAGTRVFEARAFF